MITIEELGIRGIFGIKTEKRIDHRGFLCRLFDTNLISEIDFQFSEISFVNNPHALTLRGLHFQKFPKSESKIIYCLNGSVFDVLVDLRVNSETYSKHISIELGGDSEFIGIFAPKDIAHGYLTLTDNTDMLYIMDVPHNPDFSMGIAWNDDELKINWPNQPKFISPKDSIWPKFQLIQ